jgi:hypothetical protein
LVGAGRAGDGLRVRVIVEKWRRRADERKSGGDNGRRGRAMKPIDQMIKALGDFSRPIRAVWSKKSKHFKSGVSSQTSRMPSVRCSTVSIKSSTLSKEKLPRARRNLGRTIQGKTKTALPCWHNQEGFGLHQYVFRGEHGANIFSVEQPRCHQKVPRHYRRLGHASSVEKRKR